MTKQQILAQIAEIGLVPVVRAPSADEAMRVVDAIREGGVTVLEITMTVPGALGVMEQVSKRFGQDVLLGAGTVLDAETARACMLAGARFVVSPALNLSLKAPLPQIEMIPTGGVSVKTAADFIRAGSMALGVGADLVDTQAIRDGNARVVTEKAREYVRLVQEARASA